MNKIIAQIILSTDNNVSLVDKLTYIKNVLITFTPIAFAMSWFNWWFEKNEQFGEFLIIALSMNIIVGMIIHLKNKTFSWLEFFKKNTTMIFACVSTYIVLEILRYTIGDNIIAEVFKTTIQVMTLLFPISKVIKNIYLLTNKTFPPEFFMNRLYNLEKNGNLEDFFKGNNDKIDE